MITTASTLFAGSSYRTGEHNCFYCGASCDDTHSTKTYVKPTFTNLDIVQCPASEYVCQGCVMAMGGGWEDLQMIDGTVKEFTTARGMAARMYSWLITKDKRLAFTKAHIAEIREILTTPGRLPEPPFAVVLSDSGQKQLIFRAPVTWNKDHLIVMLEEQSIATRPDWLRYRLDLASAISTKLGKPVLKEKPTVIISARAHQAGVWEEYLTWITVQHEPLSQLAAWLAPPKAKQDGG